MGVLDDKKVTKDVLDLLELFEKSQWDFKPNFDLVKNLSIINREKLRSTKMVKGIFTSKTTGSTGEPVSVEKSYADFIWYLATNIREFRWRKWDLTKNVAVINAKNKRSFEMSWGVPKEIEPKQGMKFSIGLEPISEIQKWIEKVNPHYIQGPPSVINQLDLTKIKNYIDHKGSGELGGSMYSSEECGTIAIQCPTNPNNYHVMENQIVEVDNEIGRAHV